MRATHSLKKHMYSAKIILSWMNLNVIQLHYLPLFVFLLENQTHHFKTHHT